MNVNYLTIEYIREELQDRTPLDNVIEVDQFFTDKDILHAMSRAAASYNSMAPIGVDVVSEQYLPKNTDVFIQAVIANLYSAAINKLARNLISWRTGDTTVDVDKTRMQAFTQLQQQLDQQWKTAAKQRKMAFNQAQCWSTL